MRAASAVTRVLMTTDAVGGVWQYALDLAAGLAGEGVTTMLAVMGPAPSPAQRRAAASIRGLILAERDLALEWMPDAERDFDAAAAWLRGLEDRHRPDIVHINGYAHAAIGWRSPCLVAAHSCVSTWWCAVHGCGAPAEWAPYRRRVRAGLDAADMIVTPTAAFRQMLESAHGPLTRAVTIRNGRSARIGPPVAKERFVFAAGRVWDEAKNIAALDAAAPALAWPVRVAGDPRGPKCAPRRCDNLVLLGPLTAEATRASMQRAAIFAAPARYEPFGLSVLEAAQAGCALVLGDIPTLRELWDGAARFVSPDDHDALRSALSDLIGDAKDREDMASAALARSADYSVDRMTAAYLAVYARLTARPGRDAAPPLAAALA